MNTLRFTPASDTLEKTRLISLTRSIMKTCHRPCSRGWNFCVNHDEDNALFEKFKLREHLEKWGYRVEADEDLGGTTYSIQKTPPAPLQERSFSFFRTLVPSNELNRPSDTDTEKMFSWIEREIKDCDEVVLMLNISTNAAKTLSDSKNEITKKLVEGGYKVSLNIKYDADGIESASLVISCV